MKVLFRALTILVLVLAADRSSAGEDTKVGRFNVVEVGERAILIDTATGDTWLLDKSPTSDNESRHVWLKIPSPFSAPVSVPVPTPEPPSILIEPPSFPPPSEPDETSADSPPTTSGRLKLGVKTPTRLAVGDSGTFVLHATPNKETHAISEERIELPPNLIPQQASAIEPPGKADTKKKPADEPTNAPT
jgi:hypothetical protein